MQTVKKHVLDNGLTVVMHQNSIIPKVAVQLWYAVGSKDETDGSRGLAHLLEHMLFKGTQTLSESDINLITHKLSGSCNAFTSHDFTGYMFDFPAQNWSVALSLLADCMRNCSFKPDLLNSELKAVIQELKMYKDDYIATLCEAMISQIFWDHSYHYPIIGYKQDLWNVTPQTLHAFYNNYYVPNNATLVVVGDIDPEKTLELIIKHFGSIPAQAVKRPYQYDPSYSFAQRSLLLKRDVHQPHLVFAWQIPGVRAQSSALIDVASWILAEGKGSRLYKLLVEEKALATDVQIDICELFEQSLMFLHIEPVDQEAIDAIERVVCTQLSALAETVVQNHELQRAINQSRMEQLSIFENNQKVAYEIGKLSLATGSCDGLFVQDVQTTITAEHILNFFKQYLRPSQMHKGLIVPFEEPDLQEWHKHQTLSDELDEIILSRKVRTSVVECGAAVKQITCNQPALFSFPEAMKTQLSNGLTVLTHAHAPIPKIEIILDFKVRHYNDPDQKQGLCNVLFDMLLEGTRSLPGSSFAQCLEERGMSMHARAGTITMSLLKEDLPFALQILRQIVTEPEFSKVTLDRLKQQALSDIVHYWDNPSEFATQLIRHALYKNHPFEKNILGTQESIASITLKDIQDFYHRYISPQQTIMVLVGDIEQNELIDALNGEFATWTGNDIRPLEMPSLPAIINKTVFHEVSRDQTVLCIAGHSVSRLDPDYDALLLCDQIVMGGVLGSMSSRLFQLREQSGMFYTIGGSFVANAETHPGLLFIKTLVSNDTVEQAHTLIIQTLLEACNSLSVEDLEHARNAIINSLVDNFESCDAMAQAFLFLERYNLPITYFNNRKEALEKVAVLDAQEALKRILGSNLLTLRIGRAP